jgi:hypothetical protein
MNLFELFEPTRKSLAEVLTEADGKNVHLDHAEELIFMQGNAGIARVVDTFAGLLDSLEGGDGGGAAVTTKWDGSPAIFAGIDPTDGRFFVGTKGVFAKTAKLNKTAIDIDQNHPDVKKGDEMVSKAGLRDKLYPALEYLKNLGIKGIVQGDLLFTKGDLKTVNIEGKKYIAFKPNTITYVVPADSETAKRMQAAQLGIVFHTSYTGDSIENMKASFGFDSSELTDNPSVWFSDARIKDVSGQVQLDASSAGAIRSALQDLKSININSVAFNKLNEMLPFDLIAELKAHANAPIRTGTALEKDPKQFAVSFINRMQNKFKDAISKLKTGVEGPAGQRKQAQMQATLDLLNKNAGLIVNMYSAYLKAESVKMMFQNKMKHIKAMGSFIEQPDGSFKVTDPEGFVIVDHMGNAMKIVDRLEFSAANFIKD